MWKTHRISTDFTGPPVFFRRFYRDFVGFPSAPPVRLRQAFSSFYAFSAAVLRQEKGDQHGNKPGHADGNAAHRPLNFPQLDGLGGADGMTAGADCHPCKFASQ